MTLINEIPEGEHRERLRREIFDILDTRRQEANAAFSEFSKISGLIYSGGAIAILSFIASRREGGVPSFAIASFICFGISLLSFAFFMYRHSQLHALRLDHYADVAQRFFLRKATFEEIMEASRGLQSLWLYRLVFWIPFLLAILGFALGAMAAFAVRQ